MTSAGRTAATAEMVVRTYHLVPDDLKLGPEEGSGSGLLELMEKSVVIKQLRKICVIGF